MKRGTPDHPKTLALAGKLACRQALAVGMLEMLWQWTARYAPSGDVGRWPNAALARAADWDGDADTFVSALVSCGWLDERDDCRLYIHDWSQHADDAVHMALYRAVRPFADGHLPRPAKITKVERAKLEVAWAQCAHGVRTADAPPFPPLPSPLETTDLAARCAAAAPDEGQDEDVSVEPSPKASRTTWLTPYAEAWLERWGLESEPPMGEMTKAMARAQRKLAEQARARGVGKDSTSSVAAAECVARWRRFLAAADASQYARPMRFLQGLGEWADNGPRGSPQPRRGVTAGNVAAARAFMERTANGGGLERTE